MAININARKSNEKLLCYHYKKSEYKQDLEHEPRINDFFRARKISDLVSEENGIGRGSIFDNSALQIETHDTIKDLRDGDLVKIVQFNKVFIVDSHREIYDEDNFEYMTTHNANKGIILELRGSGR